MNIEKKALFAVTIASFWASTAIAGDGYQKQTLQGKFGLTLSQSCMLTPFSAPPAVGFDSETGALVAPGEYVTAVSSGEAYFSRSGKVSIKSGVLSEIFPASINVGDLPVNPGNIYTCDGVYELNSEGSMKANLKCSIDVPQPGVKVTVSPFELEGFVSRWGQSIKLVSTSGNIQTVEVSVQDQLAQQRQRICLQDVSMLRLRHGYHR